MATTATFPIPPRHGALARAAAVATTALCLAGAVAQHRDAALPPDIAARVVEGRHTIDGVPVTDAGHLDVLVRSLGPDRNVFVKPEPGLVTTVRDVSDPVLVLTLVSALAYLAVAVAVLAPRRARAGIADLHAAFLATAVLIAVGGVTRPSNALGQMLAYSYVVAFGALPAAFLRSTLSFPGSLSRNARPIGAGVLVIALGLVAWACVAWAPCLDDPSQANYAATRAPTTALTFLFVAGIGAGLARIAWRSIRSASPVGGRQARWILAGVAFGAAPYTLLRLVPRLLGAEDVAISTAVDRTFEIAVPFTFAAAVARERLLGIDLIGRRTLVHAIVALALSAVLFGTLLGLADAVAPEGHPLRSGALALSLAIPAALFGVIRRVIGPRLDRHVFGIDTRRHEALVGLNERVAAADTPLELTTAMARLVENALHATSAEVVVTDDDERAPHDVERAAAIFDAPAGPATGAGTHSIRRELPSSESGAKGVLIVGAKTDGRAYVEDDVAFVHRVAEVTATALDRMRLRRRIAREEAARLAAADLTRRKTDFFARLAHDLRSPLASIRWSASNLKDGLAGPIAPSQIEYLRSIEAAAVQLSRLVDDLVDLGRSDLDVGKGQVVRFGDVVQEGASILKPVADSRGVRIDATVATGTPAVRGRHDAALRIVVNLLDNAVKYSPDGTCVEVSIAPTPEGGVILCVRDHGPGLPPGDRDRLFRLFEQGPESPRGGTKGFGIGLHVVKSWTEAMAGSVEADDAPGGGARFTCRFPPLSAAETTS